MKLLRFLARVGFAAVLLAGARAEPAVTPPPAFIRALETPEKLHAIQTGSVEYSPATGPGPRVWLIGVAHLGTPEYYAAIQKRLDAQTVVLFEGVGLTEQIKAGPGAGGLDSGVQKQLSKALGLTFQLDAIDYRRAHFVNSDLAVEGVQKEVRKRAPRKDGPPADQTAAAVLEAIQGSPQTEEMLKPLMTLLSASTEMRETTRLLLIEVLGRAGEMVDLAKSLSPEMKDLFEVMLTERNAIVMRDLRTQLAQLKAGQSVAIFYGAAHMPELARHLRDDLGYVAGPEQWDTAFSADPVKSAIPVAQMRLLLEMAKAQMQQAPAPAVPGSR